MTPAPRIVAVILNWNGQHMTEKCVTSLLSCNYSNLQIVIIDNGSTTDETWSLRKILFDRRIAYKRFEENLGFAGGSNMGIHLALELGADYVFLVNNDVIVKPNAIQALVRSMLSDPAIGLAFPTSLQMDTHEAIDNLGISVTSTGLPFNRISPKAKLFCASGNAMLIRKECIDNLSIDNEFFDNTFFAYAEDLDLGYRFLRSKWRQHWSSDSTIYHKGSASTSKMSVLAVRFSTRNLLRCNLKHWGLRSWLVLGPGYICALFFLFVFFVTKKRGFAFLGGIKGALGEIRIYRGAFKRLNNQFGPISTQSLLKKIGLLPIPGDYLRN